MVAEPDKNAQETPGHGPIPLNVDEGLRINTAFAYVNPARDRPNFTVRGGALVRRVVFDGDRATGVEVEHEGGISVISGRRDRPLRRRGEVAPPLDAVRHRP